MDTRLNPIRIFHMNIGDTLILRNAGNMVTADVIRSLIVALAKGITEIVILGHTDCVAARSTLAKIMQDLGISRDSTLLKGVLETLGASANEETNVRTQADTLRANLTIPAHILIHGLLFDVANGSLKVVVNGYEAKTTVRPAASGSTLNMPSFKMPSLYSPSLFSPFKSAKKS